MAGADIRPLAEIGFAENDGARLAQSLNDESISYRARPEQRQRSRRCLHAVGGVDVVFNQNWNAMQRAARAFVLTFSIGRLGHGEGIWV